MGHVVSGTRYPLKEQVKDTEAGAAAPTQLIYEECINVIRDQLAPRH